MAGTKDGQFRELLSPFLKEKVGYDGDDVGLIEQDRIVALQYLKADVESLTNEAHRSRHYESEVKVSHESTQLNGVERLYKRSILIEPTTACAAHCRWCIRGYYPTKTLSHPEIDAAVDYIGTDGVAKDVNELILTGGDPLMTPKLVKRILERTQQQAPNITRVRIHTRIPVQDPKRINNLLLDVLNPENYGFKIEVGMNINHATEFWGESITAMNSLAEAGIRLYNQHPILKGVNDDRDVLIELYDRMREHEIEPHYIFHTAPIQGTEHHRIKVREGLKLIRDITSSGDFSGRSKPIYTALTDIGKISFYDGVIVDEKTDDSGQTHLLLQSNYSYEDRVRWCPGWSLPDSAEVDDDGRMRVWYPDAK